MPNLPAPEPSPPKGLEEYKLIICGQGAECEGPEGGGCIRDAQVCIQVSFIAFLF